MSSRGVQRGGSAVLHRHGRTICAGRSDHLPRGRDYAVAEIAAAGRAAIFIPFGAATDSHQLRNARKWSVPARRD